MKPVVNKNTMATVSKQMQRRICQCPKMCTSFVSIATIKGDGLIMCSSDAEEYALEILNRVGAVMPPNIAVQRGGWTIKQEEVLIDFMKTRGLNEDGSAKYGIYSVLAKSLGKTREQIKNKVNKLREQGKL